MTAGQEEKMCIAVPCRVIEIKGDTAVIDADGVQRQAHLGLMEDIRVGDYVIVHAGYAIHRIDASEALETIKLLREMVGSMDQKTGPGE